MGWPRYLSGMLGLIATLVLAIELEGDVRHLWVPSAYLTIIGGTAALLVATFPLGDLLRGMQVAVRRLDDVTPAEKALALVVLSAAMRYPCGLGAFYCLIGMVGMLRKISDASSVGPAMGSALVGATFAVSVAEILVAPLWFRVAASQTGAPGGEEPRRPPVPLGLAAVVFLCIISMLLLLISLR